MSGENTDCGSWNIIQTISFPMWRFLASCWSSTLLKRNGIFLKEEMWFSYLNGNICATWNIISNPLSSAKTECVPVWLCLVSSPPEYPSWLFNGTQSPRPDRNISKSWLSSVFRNSSSSVNWLAFWNRTPTLNCFAWRLVFSSKSAMTLLARLLMIGMKHSTERFGHILLAHSVILSGSIASSGLIDCWNVPIESLKTTCVIVIPSSVFTSLIELNNKHRWIY